MYYYLPIAMVGGMLLGWRLLYNCATTFPRCLWQEVQGEEDLEALEATDEVWAVWTCLDISRAGSNTTKRQ